MKQQRTELLSIDPGLMTGLAAVDVADRKNPKLLWTKEKNVEQFHEFIEDYIQSKKDLLAVVMEDFIITQRTAGLSQQPWSLRLIGVVHFLAWKYDIPVFMHKPADKKFAEDNKKLQKIGFWHVGGAGHANDSCRHAIKWIVDREPSFAKAFLT